MDWISSASPTSRALSKRAAYDTGGGVDRDREVEKAGRRRQQRDVSRQSLFGRSATMWRRTILPRVTLSTGRLRLWFHTARCARVFVIRVSALRRCRHAWRFPKRRPRICCGRSNRCFAPATDRRRPARNPDCCSLEKIADRDIADARYAATDALDRRLTESTRAQPHSNVFGLPERH
jgi:hypothetical protein